MKLANNKKLETAREISKTSSEPIMGHGIPIANDGQWHPIEYYGTGPLFITVNGGTLTVEEAITLEAGQSAILVLQYRVREDGGCERRVLRAIMGEIPENGVYVPPMSPR